MVAAMSENTNRRVFPRAAVPAGSIVDYRNESGASAQAELGNLSMSGVFINTTQPAVLGEDLVMTIRLPGYDAVELRGRVARISQYQHAPGFAVNFLTEDRAKIQSDRKLRKMIEDES